MNELYILRLIDKLYEHIGHDVLHMLHNGGWKFSLPSTIKRRCHDRFMEVVALLGRSC